MAALAALPRRDQRMDDSDNARLCMKLAAYRDRWLQGESERRADDRKGAKLFRSQMWDEGVNPNQLAVTANLGKALFTRVAAFVLRGEPEVSMEALNDEEDDAARILQGAVTTNWRVRRVLELLKVGYRLCGFTRAVGIYSYWRQELRGGIGDIDKRLIPGHRLIVDDRTHRVQDMEYVGFTERMSRAKLIMLFPDKTKEIEQACNTTGSFTPGMSNDPLRVSNTSNSRVVDRLVSDAVGGPYIATTSVRIGGGKKPRDPLVEQVDVDFMWIDDPSPKREQRPKLDRNRRPVQQLSRTLDGEVIFEHDGYELIETPIGPVYQPNIKPKYEMVMEDAIVRKYKHRRHVAWIPNDNVILWDVAWDGPVPIGIERDTLPLYGFHARGSAQDLCSLAVARNVLYSIIFQRLKLSLSGTWMATPASGLRKNRLVPEAGVVFQVNNLEGVKEFPVTPLDAAYFTLLDKIEAEMEKILGLSAPMQGEAAGRADSPATYESLLEAGGVVIVDRGQMLEQTVQDLAEIDTWYIQNYYTHEHVVEFERQDGTTAFTEASALAVKGEFAVRIETGSMLAQSRTQELNEAKDAAALGFYPLPMLGKVGRIKYWRAGLKQRAWIQAEVARDPSKSWLLGASGAPPAQKTMQIRAATNRSHHRPGGK
jgi:hypothetical protein